MNRMSNARNMTTVEIKTGFYYRLEGCLKIKQWDAKLDFQLTIFFKMEIKPPVTWIEGNVSSNFGMNRLELNNV